ncbi:MAG: TIGR02302 family protein [Bradyrhizobiaceae bacterium]|nr:TIGR02302 family protein [Bradyrhizobiaceae bacterium]
MLRVALSRARRALFWERLWPLLAAIAVAAGLFLAASWAGLWLMLPPLGRIAGLVLFALILIASFVPAIRLRIPNVGEGLRRLDRGSGLEHRPATAITDTRATGTGDPVADALWRAHRDRTAEAARKLRAGWPRPHLAVLDPFALRALVLLAVIATFFMAEGERRSRIIAAFDWRGVVAPKLYRVDAWVTPPAYTGRAPVLLPGIRHDAPAPGETAAISVPAGSEVVVRTNGLDAVSLAVKGDLAEQESEAPRIAADGSTERHFKIGGDGTLAVNGLPAGAVTWSFRAIPDRAPSIAFARDPQVMGRAMLSLAYKVEDDYGVVSAEARFSDPQVKRREGAPEPRPLIGAPEFPLSLPQARTRTGSGESSKDLTEHPWAGVKATVTLAARDEGGNEGLSDAREIVLPQRSFTKPLARALIEQRRLLAFDANARRDVRRALLALMIAPEKFTPEPTVYLGLRTATTRLELARNDDELRGVVDYLWEIAVLIEDGTMSDAERELRAAQDALRQALERGASEEEIRKLTEQLRQALDKFMQALAEQLRRDGTTDARPLDRNTQVVRPQDLKSMLDRIENLARSGSRDAARRMLDELQAMLENLSRSRQAGRQQQGEMDSALDELSRMIQEQQRLRDRTYREGRESRNERRSRGPEQGRSEREQRAFGDLQRNQEGLRQQLERLLEQLRRQQQSGEESGEAGDQAGEALGRAEQAMRDAEGSLGEGNADGAVDGQGRALQNLRRGAQSMAEAMQGGPGDGPGEPGGPQAEAAERTDPLGRPVRSREYGDDFTVKVPDEIDVQRARRVLEELRRRFGEPSRPQIELDYIERLLRDF